MPSHVYVFPLTVVTCECFVTFFFNLAGRMHDLGVYEKQKSDTRTSVRGTDSSGREKKTGA